MRRFIPLLLLLVGGTIGFGLNQWHHSSGKKPDTKSSATTSTPQAMRPASSALLPLDQIKSRLAAALQRGYFREDRHWHELIESITAAEMPSLIAMIQASGTDSKYSFLLPLYRRWGCIDPAAAIPSAQNALVEDSDRSRYLISTVLEGWAYTDVRAMAEWTLHLEPGQLRQNAVSALSEFSDDLELATIIRIAREEAAQSDNQTFFTIWTERDPRAAAKAAEQLSMGPQRNRAIETVANQWVRQDSTAATNWFLGLDNSPIRMGLHEFIFAVAHQDPALAASALDRSPAGTTRLYIATGVVSIWGKTDPNAAFSWLAQKPLNSGSIELYSSLGSAVGGQDLNLAKEMAQQLPNPAVQKAFLDSAFREFAHNNPAAAWDTVSQMEPGEFKDQLVNATLSKIGNTDPTHALKLLSSLSGEYGDGSLATRLITEIGENDLAAAIEYVQLLPTVESRDNALLQLINDHGRGDFSESAIIASAISPGPAATEALTSIASDYAAYQPEEALKWLNTLPENTTKETAAVAMLEPIYRTDPSTAMALLAKIPAGENRTDAISTIVSMWDQVDSSAAIAWAKTLTGDDHSAAFGALATSWLSLEPEQATDFLANLSPEDLNSQFLNQPAELLAHAPRDITQIIDNLPASDLRQGALQTVVQSWLSTANHNYDWKTHPLRSWQISEPGQAAAWIEKTDLPAKTKGELLHIVAGGRLPID